MKDSCQIWAGGLSKTYRVPVRPEGLKASVKGLIKPTYQETMAVRDVSFSIEAGEMVGLLGPNGAGKTTTLKMLSGLLRPSQGEAKVAGFIPWKRDPAYLRQVSMVMGNKSQMLWDIPPMDSFRVLSEIYAVPPAQFRSILDELIHLLDMEELLTRPVRNLSLGERMKCELVAALLYRPAVFFLDEPTLGLDVSMQLRLRRFIFEYNQRSGVTVLLTSHYMADVMALCSRVILIHRGQALFDGNLNDLARQLAPFKQLRISLQVEKANGDFSFPAGAEIIERQDNTFTLRVPRAEAPAITAQLLQSLPIADLTVEDPPIEAVMDQIYSGGEL
jgi:ABC-2 type transport system ATP-binding protein